jgi:hypothetical protein
MTKKKPSSAQVQALAESTADAYSFDRYASWKACCAALLCRGYSDRQAEKILRSRITRWAADRAYFDRRRATSRHLLRFMDADPGAVFEVIGDAYD